MLNRSEISLPGDQLDANININKNVFSISLNT